MNRPPEKFSVMLTGLRLSRHLPNWSRHLRLDIRDELHRERVRRLAAQRRVIDRLLRDLRDPKEV